jgi:hypothetical protein
MQTTTTNDAGLWDIREAASYLGVSVGFLRKAVRLTTRHVQKEPAAAHQNRHSRRVATRGGLIETNIVAGKCDFISPK